MVIQKSYFLLLFLYAKITFHFSVIYWSRMVHPVRGPLRKHMYPCSSPRHPCRTHTCLSAHGVSFCNVSIHLPVSRSGFAVQISSFLAEQGWDQFASPWRVSGGLCDAQHAWGAPHFNGGVVTGRQQQLLVCWTEGHRVDHIIMLQACQADVVVSVPNVTMLVLCTAAQTSTLIREYTL